MNHQHDAGFLRALGKDHPALEHAAIGQLHIRPFAMTAGFLEGACRMVGRAGRQRIVPGDLDLRAAAAAATWRRRRLSGRGCLRRRRRVRGRGLRRCRLHLVRVVRMNDRGLLRGSRTSHGPDRQGEYD